MSQFFTSGGQNIGASASASFLPMNIQNWFPLGLTGLISLRSPSAMYFAAPTLFLGYKITSDGDCSHEIKRRLLLGRKVMTNLDSILKSRDYFANKGPSSQCYGFSSSHVWIQELDYNESWVPKNWCFWTAVLEKTLESPLDFKEIQPVHPKGDQSWIFTGRTDAEAETPILWPPDVNNCLIWKDPHTEKGWRQEEKGMTED